MSWLAAKLFGWKIDIKSEEEKRPGSPTANVRAGGQRYYSSGERARAGERLIEKLSAAGISTVEALADMTPEQLEAIEGIGPKTVERISLAGHESTSPVLTTREAGAGPGGGGR